MAEETEDAKVASAKPAAAVAKKDEEPPKASPDDSAVYRRVKAVCGKLLAEGSEIDRGDLILRTTLADCHELLRCLRDDAELAFDYLTCLTAVDFPDRPARFDIVWTLIATGSGALVQVVAQAPVDVPVPTVSNLWPTADWHEREAWDMFGIPFAGHPNLRRILLPDWWQGFPLRKDYPVEGRGEHELVVEECLRPQM